MHVVQRPVRQRIQRRMYLPSERMVVNGVGLGEVDGLFNIGKMFNRMFTFKKSSFSFKNIVGSVGSAAAFIGTAGLSSALAPKMFGARGSGAKIIGAMGIGGGIIPSIAPKMFGLSSKEANIVRGVTAAAGAAIGGIALAPMAGGVMTGAGSLLKSAGGFITPLLKSGAEILPSIIGGGRGGGEAGGMTQEYIAQQQQQAAYNAQQQAAYDAQLRQEAQYGANVPVSEQLTPTIYPTMPSGVASGSYGPYEQDMQIQSPYLPLTDKELISTVDPTTGLMTDPATGNKIDPETGRVIQVAQAGVIPQLSPATWIAIGGVTLLGWYLMSEKK